MTGADGSGVVNRWIEVKMLSKRELPIRIVAKWILIVALAVLAIIVLVIAFEFVRLLVDPGHRA